MPDKPLNATIAAKAYAYISGGPSWFIAPGPGTGGTTQNTSGAVAWSGTGWLNGGNVHETLESFRKKLGHSTPPMQNNWNQYICVGDTPPYGFPLGHLLGNGCNDAGMVCYVLVAQAMLDAGFTIDAGSVVSCDNFKSYTQDTGVVKPGDIVLYDWDLNGVYDHSGIVTGHTDYADSKYYTVVSCQNLIRYFNDGAMEHRLGIFDDIPASEGGPGSNYNFIFVRP